ncbi:MAG TPA: hypothetical protein VGM76_14570 [Lacipirellulaceae bacterium]|jgi:hypothetical protein
MISQQEKLRDVAWSELFRWLLLLRSVRIALMARVLVLGAIGLIATTLGWRAIGWVFSASSDPVLAQWHEDMRDWLWDKSPEFSIVTSVHSADELFASAARGLIEAPVTLWLFMARPFIDLFRSELTAIGFLCLLLCGIWELLVWGLIGGAITRIAALKFTRDEAPDMLGALAHAASKLASYSLAPLLALGGAAVFGLQLVVLGWFMRLGFFAMLAGLAWPFVLMLGLLMAILLIGALVGWPLMWATVSVEGTDAFDALSRSYAYTFQRPLRLLWYVLCVTVLAAVSMFVVKLFAASAISLGSWSVRWGLDEPTYHAIVSPRAAVEEGTQPSGVPPLSVIPSANDGPRLPAPSPDLSAPDQPTDLGSMRQFAGKAIAFWKSLLGALAAGYQAGFLWVAAVGVYLLLRKEIDGAEMDEIYVEDEQEFGMAPLAGDPATGIPEVDANGSALPGDVGAASGTSSVGSL